MSRSLLAKIVAACPTVITFTLPAPAVRGVAPINSTVLNQDHPMFITENKGQWDDGIFSLNPQFEIDPIESRNCPRREVVQAKHVKRHILKFKFKKVSSSLGAGFFAHGNHKVVWSANDNPTGIYIARFECMGNVTYTKLTLLK